jgi:hypothetical protein
VNQHHVWVWDLPPNAALDAVEELGLARFKRHDSLIGIVVVPILLKSEWFRRYVKMLIYTFSYRLVQLLNGPLPCTNVLKLVFIYLFSGITRGNGQTYRSWVNWEAHCQRCTALTRQG